MPKKSLASSLKVSLTKKSSLRKKSRKKKTAKRKDSDGHDDLVRRLNARYGKGRKEDDEVLTATVNPTTHPSSYNRLMSRVVETQLNRLTQPEQPHDLIQTIWLCALCQNRSCFDALGICTVRTMKGSLKAASTSITKQKTQNVQSKAIASKRRKSEAVKEETANLFHQNNGHIDLWMHGNCSYWAPELFLIGGRFPGLLKFLNKYWSQKCLVCSKVGASIEPKDGGFLHYPCALEKGYRLNALTLTCLSPKD
uniref:PHD-type domain-containing protein n=1 Tax=Ditylenchus dipsaci TaxID=166011 RepID=A0A915D317_9BILA